MVDTGGFKAEHGHWDEPSIYVASVVFVASTGYDEKMSKTATEVRGFFIDNYLSCLSKLILSSILESNVRVIVSIHRNSQQTMA